jgi:hypothetical protein
LYSKYKIFSKSPKRSHQLRNIQQLVDVPVLKVVEPSSTRWLAHERCVDRVLAIYPSLLLALEHIYQDAGDIIFYCRRSVTVSQKQRHNIHFDGFKPRVE